MLDVEKLVRSSYRNLDPTTLLLKPIDVLLGVSQAAKDELKDQNIVTVLDLAASGLFREVTMLVAAADDPNSEWALAGRAPRTLVDNAIVELPIEIVADREIQDLRSFSETVAGRVSTTLGVSTIRDLAAWPPYLAARQIFQQLIGRPDPEAVWDPGTPPELVPTMGRHPNERAYYQTILLDHFIDPPTSESTLIKKSALLAKERLFADAGWKPWQHTAALPLEAAGQVDIASPLLNSPGFDRVAIGALVQFSQSWYTSGLSLGQLLHSLALAPGESTRIAMIDWQRRERGTRMEGTQETDQLTSELVHNRALNEVVDAVAREVQTGSSASQASGESWGFGKSGGGGGSIGGEGQSYGFGGGYSLGYGTGKSQASSWGVSTGDRNLRAELTQNIQDLTQQASTMTRNRWATVVQEVSQQEHEQLSTRAVTNYNHMHALTIQYYEVVQIYRVAIEIDRITRCLFVPMKVLDFRRFEVVTRFRGIIADGALNAQVRATLLSAANSVVLIPARRSQPWNQGNLDYLKSLFGKTVGFPDSSEITFPRNLQPWGLMLGIAGDNTNTQEFAFDSVVIEFEGAPPQTLPISLLGPTESGALGRKYVDFRPIFGTGEGAKDFWNIRSISLKRKAGKEAYAGEIFVAAVIYPYGTTGGVTQGSSLPLFFQVQANEMLVPVYTIMRTTTDATLAQHLEENALYYSQLIWRSLDPTELSLALAAYTIGGQPLMQVIDPTPVRIAGNYMIFRTYTTDDSWQQFLDSKKLSVGPVSSTIVPLPSGGVFAEAVMGRANSAEKLDMTRFWNWQDSPIPIIAPDIAALQATSRSQPVNLDTGKLSPSVLNIMNPTQLPDPTGMTAALAALAQGTMFRDMSGLAATIGLAGTSLQEAYKGSSDAQKYAAENFKTAASLFSKASGTQGSISEQGAKVNQGKDMDAREKSNPGGVGPSEKGAAALSPPPLVEAQPEKGSLPEEWEPWPEEKEEELKHGGYPPTGGKKPARIVTLSTKLRVFVPSEVWLSATSPKIAFNGDSRTFSFKDPGSRAEIEFTAKINVDTFRILESSTKGPTFGYAELYRDDDLKDAEAGRPIWWRSKKVAGSTPRRGPTRLADDGKKFTASAQQRKDLIAVGFKLRAQPYFPWDTTDLTWLGKIVPDVLFSAVADLNNPDFDADIIVTFDNKAHDGVPRYTVSGKHDAFPAYEIYVNGEQAYAWGSESQLTSVSLNTPIDVIDPLPWRQVKNIK